MEFAAFVALRPSLRVFVLACAVLTKVFSGFRCDVDEELHLHSTQRLSCKCQRGKQDAACTVMELKEGVNASVLLPPRAMSKKTTGLIGFPSPSVMMAEDSGGSK